MIVTVALFAVLAYLGTLPTIRARRVVEAVREGQSNALDELGRLSLPQANSEAEWPQRWQRVSSSNNAHLLPPSLTQIVTGRRYVFVGTKVNPGANIRLTVTPFGYYVDENF